MICCGNKISFLWEQNNKMWEQDIILREQNKKNSRMALINHCTITCQMIMFTMSSWQYKTYTL